MNQKKDKTKFTLKPEELPIDEALLKTDKEVNEKYQFFSQELLRVSLIGIAAVGYFYKDLNEVINFKSTVCCDVTVEKILIMSLLALAVAAACALAHRYFSSDSMAYTVSYLRYYKAADTEDEIRKEYFTRKAKSHYETRDKLFRWCGYFIALSAIFIGLGAFFLVIAFAFGTK